ncbi:MAG: zf-HC2 domain-containing protein [Acidobacteriota bacterium]
MTCKDLIEFLMDYVDGELSSNEKEHFDEHLGLCPDCTAYLESYRETIRLGQMICQPNKSDLPNDIPDDLVEAILAARRAEP